LTGTPSRTPHGARARRFALLFAVLFLVPTAPAAGAGEALVLSGGGSLGLAHAGALIGLERRGHDPDFVLGTSMGAIVGALYASGYEPDSIWSILQHEDWRAIFTPIPAALGPTRALRYPAVRLVHEDGGFILRGLVSDWRINRELTRLLLPASGRARGDFDRLPRRYRSITADLESGALVPIGSGDLARAVRASMALPGFFSPVRWGGRILVDGGVNDYLPVNEARRLGATFVIAVDALKPPARVGGLDALHVVDRSLRLMLQRARSGAASPDVLVLPDLDPTLTSVVYPLNPAPIMRAGLTAALREIEPAASGDRAAPAHPRVLPPEPATLGTYTVEAPGSPLDPFLREAYRRFSGARYDPQGMLDTVDRLYETGCFDGVWPSVEDTSRADAPSWVVRAEGEAPLAAAGAVGFDDDRGGRIWAALRGLAMPASTPVQVGLEGSANGVEHRAALSFRVPSLRSPPTAWSVGGDWSETALPFLEGGSDRDSPKVRRAGGWAGAEWLRIEPSVEGAAVFRAERITSRVGPRGTSFGPLVRFGVVPRLVEVIGTAPSIEGEARFGTAPYRRARLKGSLNRSAGALALALVGDGEVVSRDAPLDAAPSLGAESLVPALRWGKWRGRARAISGVDLAYSLPTKGTLRLRLRGGVIADETRADGTYSRESAWLGGAGLSGLWWTPYGRIEVGAEAGTLGNRRLLVRLGQDF
jgi:predicted acylesterase/phospholipase RssA